MRWVRTITIRLRDGSLPGIGYHVLSPDGNTLYLTTYTYDFYFCVYDLLKDSLLVQLWINSAGEIGIKSDGSEVYVTDPGGGNSCIVFWPPPTGVLGVFDTKTNTALPGIDLTPLGDSLITLDPYYIRITPGGEKAYLSICEDRILVIDLIRKEPLKAIVIPKGNLAVHFIAL
jgi:DNA-binding beta-propeller fold protein YncE